MLATVPSSSLEGDTFSKFRDKPQSHEKFTTVFVEGIFNFYVIGVFNQIIKYCVKWYQISSIKTKKQKQIKN